MTLGFAQFCTFLLSLSPLYLPNLMTKSERCTGTQRLTMALLSFFPKALKGVNFFSAVEQEFIENLWVLRQLLKYTIPWFATFMYLK